MGSPRCTISHAAINPSPPPTHRDEQRFREHQRKNPDVGEAESLQHRQFAGAFADGLHHGAGGDQAEHEEHDGCDGNRDRADIADLFGESFNETLFGCRLRFRAGVGEHCVEGLSQFRTPATDRQS